eukprot:TRINITY_DN3486_c2_g1_i1.p1 TRINITY_DN3486_c2_g1~~TRINITY_DN3486_c2_g1_i1.p1  ORF type:complete len:670 (+),score=270.15 TRINITY_DN3486_c2_g1_i1:205-2010(+)
MKEMWRQMSVALDEATEESLPGVLDTAHAAITSGFESDNRIFNNGELSRIFEKVIDWSGAVHLRGLYFKIINTLPYLLVQKCASRVVEKLFRQCHHLLATDAVSRTADEEDSTGLPTLTTLLTRTVDVLVEGDPDRSITFIDIMQETGGSHALRVFAHVLAGREPPTQGKRQRDPTPAAGTPLGDGSAIKQFGKAVIKEVARDDIFANRCRAVPVSALVQALIATWEDGSKPMYEQISKDVAALVKNNVSSYVVEAALRSPRGHSRLHQFFLENWQTLSVHAASSWAAGCATEETCTQMIDALSAAVEQIQSSSSYALVAGAAECAVKLPSCQSKVISLVGSIFGDLNGVARTLIDMYNNGSRVGLTILAHLLAYGPSKFGKVFKGIVELPKDKVYSMLTDSSFSYVLEAFIRHGTDKDLKRLAQQLEGQCLDIALVNANACIILERLFERLSIAYRRKVVEELAGGLQQLHGSWHTQKLIKKLRLEQFVHRLPDWEEVEKKVVKKAKLLHSIMSAATAAGAQDGATTDTVANAEMSAIFGGAGEPPAKKGKKHDKKKHASEPEAKQDKKSGSKRKSDSAAEAAPAADDTPKKKKKKKGGA